MWIKICVLCALVFCLSSCSSIPKSEDAASVSSEAVAGSPTSTTARNCRVTPDCGEGLVCRDGGDGALKCLSRGKRGASCRTSLDCSAGLLCPPEGSGRRICSPRAHQ